MGVEFFPCDRCRESICDCGDYVRCNGDNENCGRRWCSDACAEADGYNHGYDAAAEEDVEPSCSFCRGEDADDTQLLEFLLERFFLTRKRVLKLYRKHNRGQ